MLLCLVRHAAVTIRPARDGFDWHLSPEGRAAASALAGEPYWETLPVLHTSPEPKALATAQRLAAPHRLPLRIEPALHEVAGRAWSEAYDDDVRRYLAGEPVAGWEPPGDALARVRSSLDALPSQRDDAAAVSHGLVLTLYLSDRLQLDAAASFEMWRSIRFPDVAVFDVGAARLERPFGA